MKEGRSVTLIKSEVKYAFNYMQIRTLLGYDQILIELIKLIDDDAIDISN